MKISKEQHDYIYNDLYLIDYLCKILKNEYFYWRNIDLSKANKFIATYNNLQFVRTELYKKRRYQVSRAIELNNYSNNVQIALNI